MQRTLVTLMLKVMIPGIKMWRGTGYHKTFEKHGKIRKIKISHVNCLIT